MAIGNEVEMATRVSELDRILAKMKGAVMLAKLHNWRNIVRIPTAEIRVNPEQNPRATLPDRAALLKTMEAGGGADQPIIGWLCDGFIIVSDGHGRLICAIEMGAKFIEVIVDLKIQNITQARELTLRQSPGTTLIGDADIALALRQGVAPAFFASTTGKDIRTYERMRKAAENDVIWAAMTELGLPYTWGEKLVTAVTTKEKRDALENLLLQLIVNITARAEEQANVNRELKKESVKPEMRRTADPKYMADSGMKCATGIIA